MEKITAFNIRAYGIVIHQQKVLLLHENYAGSQLLKFPGGGVEFGEGLKDALVREFKEELNLDIKVQQLFYTQDFFLQSRFKENEQIITHYYYVNATNLSQITILDEGIKEVLWIPFSELEQKLTLPVDKIVAKKLNSIY